MQQIQQQRKSSNLPIYLGLFIDAGLPYIAYLILRGQNVGIIPALAISSIFPVINVIREYVKQRKLDGFGVLILAGIVFTMLASLTSGDQRFALVKESFFGIGFGLLCLASFFTKKPLMFYFARKFGSDGSDESIKKWDQYWVKSPGFRKGEYLITGIWAFFSILQAVIVIVAAYSSMSADSVVSLSNITSIGVNVALVTFSIWYGRRKLTPLTKAEVMAYDAKQVNAPAVV